MFVPTPKTKIYINVESLKHARLLIEDESCEGVESSHLFSQLRQARFKFHCLLTYSLCRSFLNLAIDIAHRPCSIWTLYNYQKLDLCSEEKLKIFSANRSFYNKKWVQYDIQHHKSISSIWHFEQTKEIVADIVNLPEEGNVTITMNNGSFNKLLKKPAENMTNLLGLTVETMDYGTKYHSLYETGITTNGEHSNLHVAVEIKSRDCYSI